MVDDEERQREIASGYAKTKEVDLAQELGTGKYIKKPYILEKIGLAIRKNWKNRRFLGSSSIGGFMEEIFIAFYGLLI